MKRFKRHYRVMVGFTIVNVILGLIDGNLFATIGWLAAFCGFLILTIETFGDEYEDE